MTIPTHLLESKLITNKEWDEYQELKKIVYDPEDMTLLFMYCGEKAKDKIKRLEAEQTRDKQMYQIQISLLRERIDKAIEYIEEIMPSLRLSNQMYSYIKKHLLEILKGDSNE